MNKKPFLLLPAFLALTGFLLVLVSLPNQTAVGNGGELVGIYVLGFDNDPEGTVDLSQYYTETHEAIRLATIAPVRKTAVVLTDLGTASDTHIVVYTGGNTTTIDGLPDASGVLDGGLKEYNTASGVDLGGFLKWALVEYPGDRTFLSIIAHGAPLVPETDIAAVLNLDGGGGVPPDEDDLFAPPLPINVDANPDITDFTSLDLLSPYDLALALQTAVVPGAPIDVLDLVHCFSGTVEELYELSNPTGRPWADIMTAAPNYAFFAPAMIGDALEAADPLMNPNTLADTLIAAYDQSLFDNHDIFDGPDVEHPRVLIAVDSSALRDVKEAWDRVSYHLLEAYAVNGPRVEATYLEDSVGKYDTTYCQPQDWALEVPDALVDLGQMADELAAAFPVNDPVAIWAAEARDAADSAVTARYSRDGFPWFGGDEPSFWDFGGATGLALYADWAGATADNGDIFLSWHARWYTDTVDALNPQPYLWVQGGFDGATWQATGDGRNWGDVFHTQWAGAAIATPIQTVGCLPVFPPLIRHEMFVPSVRRP